MTSTVQPSLAHAHVGVRVDPIELPRRQAVQRAGGSSRPSEPKMAWLACSRRHLFRVSRLHLKHCRHCLSYRPVIGVWVLVKEEVQVMCWILKPENGGGRTSCLLLLVSAADHWAKHQICAYSVVVLKVSRGSFLRSRVFLEGMATSPVSAFRSFDANSTVADSLLSEIDMPPSFCTPNTV